MRRSPPLLLLSLLAACPDDGDGTGVSATQSSMPTTVTMTGSSGEVEPTGTAGPPTSSAASTEASSAGTGSSTGTSDTTDTTGTTGTTGTSGTTGTTGTTGAVNTTTGSDTGSGSSSTGEPIQCSDKPAKPAGPEVQIAPAFAGSYTTYELGPVPGIPADARLGGCVIAFDDPDSLLIAGYSEAANGQLYRIGVERGDCDHIVAFKGDAVSVASTPYIDANLIYVKSGLLFYSEWPVNRLSQLLPGANAPARTTGLDALGVASSIGGIGFVPPGYADEGGMRLLSWAGGEWTHLERQPDGELFTVSAPLKTATLPNGPGGFAYIPKGSPAFDVDHVIVSEWSTNTVGTYEVDDQGDPIVATRKDFFTAFPRPWGAYFEPQTGDFMFLTWGAGVDRVYIVQGFEPPPPLPQ